MVPVPVPTFEKVPVPIPAPYLDHKKQIKKKILNLESCDVIPIGPIGP